MEKMYRIHYSEDYLQHHGIKGQKWGVRRFQNEDGSLTSAGEKRYNSGKTIRGFDEKAYRESLNRKNEAEKQKADLEKYIEDSDFYKRDKEVQDTLANKNSRRKYMKKFLDENKDNVKEIISYMKDEYDYENDYKALRSGEHYEIALEKMINRDLDSKYGSSYDSMYWDFVNGFGGYSEKNEKHFNEALDIYYNKLQDRFKKSYSNEMFSVDEEIFNEWAKDNLKHFTTDFSKYRIHYSDDYLEHHGVIGMKWGVRRYQNSDGSLTDLGKKRRNKTQNKKSRVESIKKKIEKAKTKVDNKRSEIEKSSNKIDVKSLSDEELRRMTNRMRLETDFMNAQLARYPVKPKTKSFVKKTIGKIADASVDALSGAIREAGKDYIKKQINIKIRQNETSPLDYLKSFGGNSNNAKKNNSSSKKKK